MPDSPHPPSQRPPRAKPRQGPECLLVPEDYDRALCTMKRNLALLQLRRTLLDPALDAPAVLAVSERILALQGEGR